MNDENYYRAKFDPTLCASSVIDAFDLGFNLRNLIKYVLRAGRKKNAGIHDDADKNSLFDLRKSKRLFDAPNREYRASNCRKAEVERMTLADMIKQLTELRKQMPATAPVYLGTAFGDLEHFFTDFDVSKIGGKIIGLIPSDRWKKNDSDVRKENGTERR